MNSHRIAIPCLTLASVLFHAQGGHCDILHDQSVRAQTEYDAAVDEVKKKETELGTKLDGPRKDVEKLLAIGGARDRYLTALHETQKDTPPYTGEHAWLLSLCGGIAAAPANADDGDTRAADAGPAPPAPAPPAAPERLSPEACLEALTDGESRIRALQDLTLRNVDDVKAHPVQQALEERRSDLKTLKRQGGHLADYPVLASFCQLGPNSTAAGAIDQCGKQIEELSTKWNAFASARTADQELVDAIATATARRTKAETARDLAVSNEAQSSTPTYNLTLADRLRGARRVRCITAYCWGGDGTRYAVEPVLDLPVGMFWALGNGSLANYVNSNRLDISIAAGLRVWFADDQLSLGVLLARPSLSKSGPIRLEFSDKPFPMESIGRPFPTLMVGAFGDSLILTVSYDQVRNTDGTNPVDPNFLPGEVLSRAVVLGLAISPFTTARNAVGASTAKPLQEDK